MYTSTRVLKAPTLRSGPASIVVQTAVRVTFGQLEILRNPLPLRGVRKVTQNHQSKRSETQVRWLLYVHIAHGRLRPKGGAQPTIVEQYHLIQAVAAATRPKQRWSNEEMLMMANQEAEMLLADTSPVLINQQLCGVVPRSKAYRDIVQSFLAEMRVAAIPDPVPTPPAQVGRAQRGDPNSPPVPDDGELAVNPD